jgi:hypothetical protein
MKTLVKTAIAIAALALVACDTPQDAKPTPPPTPAANAPTASPATNTPTTTGAPQTGVGVTSVTIPDSDLASPADYEAQVETTITSKNYKTAISSLEAEIGN